MMTGEASCLPEYRVRAHNTATDSENKIHDDAVAAQYGFRGGLVPGVIVYGYMTAPLVQRYSLDWLARGSMQVRFHQPFYEGDEVIVRVEAEADSSPATIAVTASGADRTTRATALATVDDGSAWLGEPPPALDAGPGLPPFDARPVPSLDSLKPGTRIGSFTETVDLKRCESELLDVIEEKMEIYRGDNAVAHPAFLLGLCNQSLVLNYKLGPWIHTASEIKNWDVARDREEITVSGGIRDAFERKGHELVVLDLRLTASGRLIQQVRHTAIFRPRRGRGV